MLLLEVIDLEYVLDTLRGNKHELRPVPRDRGAHVTSPSFEYIRTRLTQAVCVLKIKTIVDGGWRLTDADASRLAHR
jgi:hypothetical protein